MNIGFLASHNGSNMQAIIDASNSGALSALPAVVISNNSKSGAIERAKKEGIPHYHLSGKHYPDPKELDQAILNVMIEHSVNIIILAGYMKKIGPKTLSHFEGRILNIHPALLPKYGGKGMYGHYVHDAVIQNREKETGITIHYVNSKYDEGEIIHQSFVKVEAEDTPDSLAKKIHALEYEHFPRIVEQILKND